jgi:hypothetical protein
MNLKTISIIMAFSLALSGAVRAAGAKTQEVTATVLQTTPTKIDLDPQTKILGELKVGAKVTITYAMSAAKIDAGPNKTQGRCRRGSSSNHFERSPPVRRRRNHRLFLRLDLPNRRRRQKINKLKS